MNKRMLLLVGLAVCVGCSTTDSDDDTSSTSAGTGSSTAATSTVATATSTAATTSETTGATTTDGTSTDAATTDATTTDAATTGSTTGPVGDPNYPPSDDTRTCPDGFAFAGFDDEEVPGAVCLPECPPDRGDCPAASTGDAIPVCAVNPTSTGTPCRDDDGCADPGESCRSNGAGGMACGGDATHCVLTCFDGETCPDGMVCSMPGACQYPS